ncbi:MAG: arabinose isomerase [Treponema sp. GWB1_62_6]|nr:MAG: arabinose isomerase [Treponema sp. GWA1_62_8]OHE63000.1 MAG: arabinose isomerase [Treponema sp. GWB1_62_6]OHE66482.1 MAG: arabinose isomerase [Treponema sp. GWC1_61_84]HCM29128.1 arabinose isomerase [Treponema sp.]
MLEQRKPKIGLLGIMHGLYDESQPEITRNQEQFARDVVRSLSPYAEVDFPRAAKNRADIESIVEGFNHGGFDGILVVMLLYSPGFRLVRALEENRLPLMLANIQPLPSVTADWDWRRLTTNQGIHGAQDTASMMLQAGVDPTIVTDDWSGDDFREHFGDWARAVMTIASLKKMRIACFGRMKGMGDIVGDEGNFQRVIGPEVNHEGIGQVFTLMESSGEAEIDALMELDRKNFVCAPDLSRESHRYALRMQLGFEKFLVDRGYDGFTANFDSFREDGRFRQIQMLAASNLMAKGYGYSNEGDVHTTALVAAGHLIAGHGHFTEMYSLDFKRDSALMSHMGEGNWRIARKDRPIRLIDRPLEIGGLENPPTLVFSAQPGKATMLSLASIAEYGYRLICSPGEILDTEELPGVPMPYFHFRPATGIRSAMDNWLRGGGTHHEALTLGAHHRRWRILARHLGIEYLEV